MAAKQKILIVDDEEKIRELIRMNLELAGYKCDEAEDGEMALAKFRRTDFPVSHEGML